MDKKLTVKKFMLNKFPTDKYLDCPIPKHQWETIQEYADVNSAELSIKYNRTLGEFLGYLEGVLAWDIPDQLRAKIEIKIKELEKIIYEN